jgi:hypothetical protein
MDSIFKNITNEVTSFIFLFIILLLKSFVRHIQSCSQTVLQNTSFQCIIKFSGFLIIIKNLDYINDVSLVYPLIVIFYLSNLFMNKRFLIISILTLFTNQWLLLFVSFCCCCFPTVSFCMNHLF